MQKITAVATKYLRPDFQFMIGDVVARSWEMETSGAVTMIRDNGDLVIHCEGNEYWIPEYEAVLVERKRG